MDMNWKNELKWRRTEPPSSQEDGIDHTAREDGAESYSEDLGPSCELFQEELAEGALERGRERLGEEAWSRPGKKREFLNRV